MPPAPTTAPDNNTPPYSFSLLIPALVIANYRRRRQEPSACACLVKRNGRSHRESLGSSAGPLVVEGQDPFHTVHCHRQTTARERDERPATCSDRVAHGLQTSPETLTSPRKHRLRAPLGDMHAVQSPSPPRTLPASLLTRLAIR